MQHDEKIERFCLPLFSAAGSDYAVGYVMKNFKVYPAMSQIYSNYLARFLGDRAVYERLGELLVDEAVYFDWQKMWILAALLSAEQADDNLVLTALRIFRDGYSHEALRAVAAIFVAKHGAFTRKKELADSYGQSGSQYIQTAVLYGARYMNSEMRRTSLKSWGGHSAAHRLVAASISQLRSGGSVQPSVL